MGAKYPAAPLGLLTVAALLPRHWEIKLVDENVAPLADADLRRADIVMTGGMLPQQKGVLEVMARAHAAGKPVVVGGPDPTSQPAIYRDADYLVLGEGEVTVPLFLAGLKTGARRGTYTSAEKADMKQAVIPRYDLIKFSSYMHVGIQFSRGCPYDCEFCDVIELFGRRPRVKASEQVIRELQALYDRGYRGHVDFVDDNFIGNRKEVVAVLTAVRAWQKERRYPFYFTGEASLNLAKDVVLLELMRDNDFRYIFVGVETADERILDKTAKQLAADVSIAEAIRTISSYGMIVNAGFIMGFDKEDDRTAENMIACIQDTGICMAMVGMLFALPNTRLARRLKDEGRLFADGVALADAVEEIDQTSSGLNFVTTRPYVDVLRDYVRVLEHVYAPKNYYARVKRTGIHLGSHFKHRPSFFTTVKMLWAFAKVCATVSVNPAVGWYYWKTFGRFIFHRPRSAIATVDLAAMYLHFGKQARHIVDHTKKRIARIAAAGDGAYYGAAWAARGPS